MSETLTPESLRLGYSLGYFPMADEDGRVEWYRSYERAMFPIAGIRVSHSLRRRLSKVRVVREGAPEGTGWEATFDQAFEAVVRGCKRPDGSWISEEIVEAYTLVHGLGWAHSCEVWFEGELEGGVYGLAFGTCFCAESMFHWCTDASKIALWALVERCRELGFTLFDAQMMSPHLTSLGAYPMTHAEYLEAFAQAQKAATSWSA